MAILYHQSSTASLLRRVPLHLVSGTNGLTKATAATASQWQISKRGGAFATSTASLIEVSNGLYFAQLTAAQLDTIGFAVIRAKTTKTAESQTVIQVVPWNPNLDTSDRLRVQVHGMATGVIAAATFADGALASRAIANKAIHTSALATGAVHVTALAAKSIHATALATGALTATGLSNAAANKIADTLGRRSLGNMATSAYGQTASGRNILQGARMLANRTLLSASFVVFKENDTTVAFRKAVTLATGLASTVISDLNTV